MATIVLFCHSLRSDWNHGNAHFLRGVLDELRRRGFDVRGFEPAGGWSAANLGADHGSEALVSWREAYPELPVTVYDPARPDLDKALDGASVVLAHEWNEPALIAALARRRRSGGRFLLLFHDTHHRMVSAPEEMARFDLNGFDGVLAFGETLSASYRDRGWGANVFTWHEAADTRLFRPFSGLLPERDLVWVGNWGDGERSRELAEFLVDPVAELGLTARVHGVRYPPDALAALNASGIEYSGYLPNIRASRAFAAARMTVHVPRRPYAQALPGIPTIRVFEALASGIPLISAPWEDCENLFAPGDDFLVAQDGAEMRRYLAALRDDADLRADLSRRGRATILARHTCAHRVDELLGICAALGHDLPEPALAGAR